LTAKIISTTVAKGNDPATLFVVYSNQTALSNKFLGNESLVIIDPSVGTPNQYIIAVNTLDVSVDDKNISTGDTSTFTVSDGLYFYDGKYLQAPGGSLVLDKYSNVPTYKLGYMVKEGIATSISDPTLLDPAISSSNAGGSGADRQKFSLSLYKHGNGVSIPKTNPPGFFEIARIVKGNIEWQIQEALFTKIGDELAKRTFDESGNYVVEFPTMDLSNQAGLTAPSYTGTLSKTLAYVKGYRIETPPGKKVSFDKSRTGLVEEGLVIQNPFRNYVFVSDHPATSGHDNEKANGLFSIGAQPKGEWAHVAGTPVDFHSVMCENVNDTTGSGLTTGANNWNSTLIGTMKPLMMFRDGYETGMREAGQTSEALGYRDAYQLYFADFKPKTITGTSNATNIIPITGGAITGGTTYYYFAEQDHGIAAGEHFSISTGSSFSRTGWSGYGAISTINTTSFSVVGDRAGGFAFPTDRNVRMITAGNVAWSSSVGVGTIVPTINQSDLTPVFEFIIMEQENRSPVSEAYVGGTITLTGGTKSSGETTPETHTATIVRYEGDNDSEHKAGLLQFIPKAPFLPTRDTTYSISLGVEQARSVIYNGNMSAAGEQQYPGIKEIQWNIDPAGRLPHPPIPGSGPVVPTQFSDNMKITKYNDGMQHGSFTHGNWPSLSGDSPVLMSSAGVSGVRRTMTHGDIHTGLSSNSTIYYVEALSKTGTATPTLTFSLPSAGHYKFFGSVATQPVLYPYEDRSIFKSAQGSVPIDEIKNNFILVNKTTGNVATKFVQQLDVDITAGTIVVTAGFAAGDEYVLLAPVRADHVKPAKKKRITANVTHSATGATDFANGQIFIPSGSVSLSSAMSLEKPDVIKIRKVVRDFDPDDAFGVTDLNDSAKDVTSAYTLDTGQRDFFYDNGSIKVNDGETPPAISLTSNLFVCFDYAERQDYDGTPNANSPSFFSIDSYQYTSDLVLSSISGTAFSAGDYVVGSASKATGYVFDIAVDGSSGAMQVEHVNGKFSGSDTITIGDRVTDSSAEVDSVVSSEFRYEEIPTYTSSKNGKTYTLKDMIDFRPYVANANGILQPSTILPVPSTHRLRTGVDHGFGGIDEESRRTIHNIDTFVGRIDKLVLHKSGNYRVIRGEPSLVPIPPRDDTSGESITLFTVNIPPRSDSPKLLLLNSNKRLLRHTMEDIGKLARRVDNLEYYVSLNALELAASSMTILDGNGLDRFKNGILVDPFDNKSVVDQNNLDIVGRYQIGDGKLRPGVEDIADHDVFINEAGQSNINMSGHSPGKAVIMLDYESVPFITQEQWTEPVSVNPYDIQNYTGTMTLTPDADRGIDYTHHPQFQLTVPGQDIPVDPASLVIGTNWATDNEGILSSLLGTVDVWSRICGAGLVKDNSILSGSVQTRVDGMPWDQPSTVNRNIQLTGAGPASTPELDAALAELASVRNVPGSETAIPYVRRKDIVVDARGMKPNWNLNSFFDKTYVEQYRAKATEIHMQWETMVLGHNSSTNLVDRAFLPMSSRAGEMGDYEKIGLYTSGHTHVANAWLLAVRSYHHTDKLHSSWGVDCQDNVKIGYIVPIPNEATGVVDYFNFLDGYYNPGGVFNISTDGWNGTASRYIKGYVSGATCDLKSTASRSHEWNGHYTGTAAFYTDHSGGWAARQANPTVHSNTTHLVLSADANRYIANNFGIYVSGATGDPNAGSTATTRGYPFRTTIKIVGGSGRGQVGFVNSVSQYVTGDGLGKEHVVVEWKGNGIASNRPLDDTSVYSICMSPCAVNRPNFPGISQFGGIEYETNKYGEQFSVLHIPNNNLVNFTSGQKLVELKDRASDAPWLITSYSSQTYHAEGSEVVEAFDKTPATRALHKLRTAARRIAQESSDPFALQFIPATSGELDGKLAVCTHVTVNNPGTSDSTFADNRGPEIYGSVGYDSGAGGS
jgi:hypothetical protein